MAAAVEDLPVTYEELADLEKEFDDVDTEILRRQVEMTKPLYARRQKTVARIPNFWPLVMEQAPPDIDQFVQPSDSALLSSSLTGLAVTHIEADKEPRSVAIRWEFADNEWFEDRVLEKRFWHRRARGGWSGLVSEPVAIRWKKGRDLTGGLLDAVGRVWDEEEEERAAQEPRKRDGRKAKAAPERGERTAEQKALKKKIENTGLGGLSFFAWFGYVGRRVSAEEDRLTRERDEARRKARQLKLAGHGNGNGNGNGTAKAAEEKNGDETAKKAGNGNGKSAAALKSPDDQAGNANANGNGKSAENKNGDEVDVVDLVDDEDDDVNDLEIFPDGEELAIAISQDLWPGAIKYFTQAMEEDGVSDDDFESDGEGDDDGPDGAGDGEPPAKKRKS